MKSQKALNRLFSFERYKLCDFSVEEKEVNVFLKKTRKTCDCPKCSERRVKVIEIIPRQIRDLDISGKKCYIYLETSHIKCSCGYYGMEKLDFLGKYERRTNRFNQYVADLCKRMSLKDVAHVARINWKTAKRIDKLELGNLERDLSTIDIKKIGIDEIAYEKGHKYLTVVRDLDLGIVIWVGTARKQATLDFFFSELGKFKCSKITLAVMDMWDPFISSVKKNTDADIVFDKFHVSKKINEALDKIRKFIFAKGDGDLRKTIKKKRFIILKKGKNLSENEKETLNGLMKTNEPLYQAYLLKEQALDIFDEENLFEAMTRFATWIKNVAKSGLEQFMSVVKTIKRYFFGIINYFRYRVTNAASEGFNTKITVIKRRAYGFRDLEYFKLKILQSCG